MQGFGRSRVGIDEVQLGKSLAVRSREEGRFAGSVQAEAASRGGTAPAVYKGANEACVTDFLAGRIPFTRIVDTVARIVSEHDTSGTGVTTLEDVLAVDAWARARARELNR